MRAEAQSRLKSPPLKKGPESRPSRLKGSRSASKYILMFDAFRWGGRRYGGRKIHWWQVLLVVFAVVVTFGIVATWELLYG